MWWHIKQTIQLKWLNLGLSIIHNIYSKKSLSDKVRMAGDIRSGITEIRDTMNSAETLARNHGDMYLADLHKKIIVICDKFILEMWVDSLEFICTDNRKTDKRA
jgi:hypothetical protein